MTSPSDPPRQLPSRRTFLRGASLGGLLVASGQIFGPAHARATANGVDPIEGLPAAEPPTAAEFLHSVASGDPLIDAVVIWTRVTTAAAAPVEVRWVLGNTPDLEFPVQEGTAVAAGLTDHTCKVDVRGLSSWTTYYYRFSVVLRDGSLVQSPVGRTKTAPKKGDTDRVRIAGVSCQNFIYGFFNPLRALAYKPDLDLVVHLGDYIYEQGGTALALNRDHQPAGEVVTLADYRIRYAQYRTDVDLQEAHRQFPMTHVWDDHETANNSWVGGSDRHDPAVDGSWEERKAAAIRAFFEWLPIRNNVEVRDCRDTPSGRRCTGGSDDYDNAVAPFDSPDGRGYLATQNGKITKVLEYGDVARVVVLDTRLIGRAEPVDTTNVSPQQTILGPEQMEWFLGELSSARAQWTLVVSAVQFAPFKVTPLPEDQGGTYFLEDSWDGYRHDRNLVMKRLADNRIDNVIFLSGDSHSMTSWDLPVDPHDRDGYDPLTGEGSLAVEFGSGAIANSGVLTDAVRAINPHMKYASPLNGYVILDFDRQRVQGDYFATGAPSVRNRTETFQRALVNQTGSNRLTTSMTQTEPREDAPALAPQQSPGSSSSAPPPPSGGDGGTDGAPPGTAAGSLPATGGTLAAAGAVAAGAAAAGAAFVRRQAPDGVATDGGRDDSAP